MSINIDTIEWDGPFPHGGRYFRTADIPDGFWEDWREDKVFLKKQGLAVFKNKKDECVLSLWTDNENLPGHAPVVAGEFNDLPPLPPIETKLGEIELLPPQIPHVQNHVRALRLGNCAIDASDCGVGKTPSAIMTAHNLGLHPVILCPKSVIASWREWGELAGVRVDVTNYEQAIRGNWPHVQRTDRKRPGYMKFEWTLRDPKKYLLIFDEGHRLKGEETLTALLLGAAKRAGVKTLVLSATLIETVLDMKNLTYVMGWHHWSNWDDFLSRNGCICVTTKREIEIKKKDGTRFTKEIESKSWDYVAGKFGMKQLHKRIFPRIGSRLSIKDMDGFFPDNHIIPTKVNIGGVEKIYEAMRSELKDLEMKRKRDEYISDSKLTILLRAQQEAELLRVPAAIEMARDLEQEGRSVAIFCQFRETLTAIQKSLDCLSLHGDLDQQADFQAERNHFIGVQIQAGGTGVSLHQKSPNMRPRSSIIMPVFNGRDLKQALGRVFRANAASPTTQYIIFDAKSPTDLRVCRSVQKKLGNMDAFNGSLEELVIIDEGE